MIGLLSLLVLNGCNTDQGNEQKNQTQSNDSSTEKSSEKVLPSLKIATDEDDIVKSAGVDEYFAYTLHSDQQTGIEIWVDYYEKGKLKQKILRLKDEMAKQDSRISFSMINMEDESLKKTKWTISIYDKTGSGSSSSVVLDIPIVGIRSSSKVNEVTLKANEAQPLAAVLMTKGDELHTSDNLVDKNTVKQLIDQDYVYLLQIKLVDGE